jgi:TRAP-type mannitol/chloroaromatic compound transport system permease large subunit
MFRSVAMPHRIITGIILSLFMFSYPVDFKLKVQGVRFAILHFVYNMVDNRQMAIDCA